MSFVLNTPAGNPVDLGGTFDLLFAFRAMGHTEDDPRFGELFSVPQLEGETLTEAHAKQIGQQARDFLVRNKDKLSANAQWILQQLSQVDNPLDKPLPGEPPPPPEPPAPSPPENPPTKPGAVTAKKPPDQQSAPPSAS